MKDKMERERKGNMMSAKSKHRTIFGK